MPQDIKSLRYRTSKRLYCSVLHYKDCRFWLTGKKLKANLCWNCKWAHEQKDKEAKKMIKNIDKRKSSDFQLGKFIASQLDLRMPKSMDKDCQGKRGRLR